MSEVVISGVRPPGYRAEDGLVVRIPYGQVPEEHADIRRKLAAGWKLGEVRGDPDSLFKFACVYPPLPPD